MMLILLLCIHYSSGSFNVVSVPNTNITQSGILPKLPITYASVTTWVTTSWVTTPYISTQSTESLTTGKPPKSYSTGDLTITRGLGSKPPKTHSEVSEVPEGAAEERTSSEPEVPEFPEGAAEERTSSEPVIFILGGVVMFVIIGLLFVIIGMLVSSTF